MTRYTGLQIRDACLKAGFSGTPSVNVGGVLYSPADVMAAIALGESGGDDQAVNSSSGAAGVFQILPSVWGGLISQTDMHDLNASALFCYNAISHHGTYFDAWVVYTEGTYRHFLPLAGATGVSVPASPVADPTGPTGTNAVPGAQQAGTILGLVPPSADELKRAGLLLATAMTGIFLVVVGVGAWTKEPIETVVKAVA